MVKNYILDTNCLLQDPDSIFSFKENNVVIPIGVLEELDRFKKERGELGVNSREVCRNLDIIREKGDLQKGAPLDNGFGGTLRVYYNGNLHSYNKETNVDLHVIYVAKQLSEIETDTECIIVSKDINVRVRASALGLKAENYENAMVKKDIDRGFAYITCSNEICDKLRNSGRMQVNEIEMLSTINHYPNFYLAIEPSTQIRQGKKDCVLAKISYDGKFVNVLPSLKQGMRISPKNIEQTFVMDALLDENIKFVSVIGSAGSGKTILSTAIGFYLVSKTDSYYKLLISRPMVHMGGKDTVGFLPGDISEKIDPWLKPIYDSFEVLNGKKNKDKIDGKTFVQAQKNIEIEILSYLRGRSINDQFFLIDEAQNTSSLEIKTIITRAGEGTKVVLTGDIDQIDCPYLDKESNGLVVATDAFIGSDIAAHIVMSKGVRSRLSDEASKRL